MSQLVYVLRGKCPGGKCPGGKCLGGKCPGGICPGGICPWGKCPGGLCPRTVRTILKEMCQNACHELSDISRHRRMTIPLRNMWELNVSYIYLVFNSQSRACANVIIMFSHKGVGRILLMLNTKKRRIVFVPFLSYLIEQATSSPAQQDSFCKKRWRHQESNPGPLTHEAAS